jgi:methylated-DNA-[protein]-cysteine S-methyltransferase
MLYTTVESPVGPLLLRGGAAGLSGLAFMDGRWPGRIDPAWRRDDQAFAPVAQQLQEYFAGERRQFTVPIALEGNQFQLRVWDALQQIPYGQTLSYGALAASLGDPSAARAVGSANARNPVALIVPCHRVIGADGSLTGFGGGLAGKRFLLDLEAGVRSLVASG